MQTNAATAIISVMVNAMRAPPSIWTSSNAFGAATNPSITRARTTALRRRIPPSDRFRSRTCRSTLVARRKLRSTWRLSTPTSTLCGASPWRRSARPSRGCAAPPRASDAASTFDSACRYGPSWGAAKQMLGLGPTTYSPGPRPCRARYRPRKPGSSCSRNAKRRRPTSVRSVCWRRPLRARWSTNGYGRRSLR